MQRREFIAGATAALMGAYLESFAQGQSAASVGKPLAKWQPGHFQIHSIYTGVCESMFIIYPDGTTLLVDVGDHAAHKRGKKAIPILPSMARHSGEWVSRYVLRVNPQGDQVDRFLLSHYHNDHGGGKTYGAGPSKNGKYELSGLGQAIEFLKFGQAIDRDYPNFSDPYDVPPEGDGGMLANLREVYAEMTRRGIKIEKFKLEKGSTQFAPLRGGAKDFSIRPICANGRILFPDGKVKDLYAHLKQGPKKPRRFNENGMSIGQIFSYGKFRYFSAGDFSDWIKMPNGKHGATEDLLGAVTGPVNVAKVNHHGHHSMFPGLVKSLRAQVYFACMWDQMHMTSDTMSYLADRASYPEERLLCPAVFTPERRKEDAGKAWTKDVPKAVYEPQHLVFDVPPGGETFKLTFVTAKDESMLVTSERTFKTRG